MSERRLPTAAQALHSLRASGDQFATAPLAPRPLGGVLFVDHNGPGQVEADDRVLDAIGQIYTANGSLRRALLARRARAATMAEALRLIAVYYRQERRVMWGISGYASIGPECGPEADYLEALYGYFTSQDNRRPSVVYDGAAGAGVLGINGVLGAERGVRTLGVIPLKGIASMAPRDHMVVYGHTYQQREVIVGSLPDALVVAGGGEGAMREAIHAVNGGGRVMLVGNRGLAATWRNVPQLVRAARRERLVACEGLDEIAGTAEQMRLAILVESRKTRPSRFRILARRLQPGT